MSDAQAAAAAVNTDLEQAIEAVLHRFRIPFHAPGEVEGQWDRGDLASDIAEAVRAFGPLSDGAWIAQSKDGRTLRVFAQEIDALRCAVENGMDVLRVSWSEEIERQPMTRSLSWRMPAREGERFDDETAAALLGLPAVLTVEFHGTTTQATGTVTAAVPVDDISGHGLLVTVTEPEPVAP